MLQYWRLLDQTCSIAVGSSFAPRPSLQRYTLCNTEDQGVNSANGQFPFC